jgi:hypothetical protein
VCFFNHREATFLNRSVPFGEETFQCRAADWSSIPDDLVDFILNSTFTDSSVFDILNTDDLAGVRGVEDNQAVQNSYLITTVTPVLDKCIASQDDFGSIGFSKGSMAQETGGDSHYRRVQLTCKNDQHKCYGLRGFE